MSEETNEEIEKLQKKLDYIGLDFDNIPEFLRNTENLDFILEKAYSEETYRVYKYVPINDIQIIFTKANRMNSIQEKYQNINPIYPYLVPENEEGIIKHSAFLKMLKTVEIEEIEEIEKQQEKLNNDIPFLIKYDKNYLWEIYYSNKLHKYFMLVTTEDKEYGSFFYLLREQLKNRNQNKKVFVPVSYMDYSNNLLEKDNFKDLEKYVWKFTKEWPIIYEVYDKDENPSIQICGKTIVYGKLESIYKIKLDNKKNATKFFKLIKALFILETEFPHDYKFEIQISQYGGLELVYNSKIITYEILGNFIKEQYKKKAESLRILKKEEKILKEVLDNLKIVEAEREKEYLLKQNQVATYLKCRKTFFGRVRYFFKGKLKDEINKLELPEPKIEVNEEEIKQEYEKEFYTIEDLINVCKELNIILNTVKNIKMDKTALEIRNNQLKVKINNASKFIEEIDSHRKSIFEFWRFANKDNGLALESGTIEEKKEENNKIPEPYFDYIEDIEEIAIRIDELQRKILSKEDTDNIFLALTRFLKPMNAIKSGKQYNFTTELEDIKNDLRSLELLFGKEEFDIFGSSTEDKTKINVIKNKKHRENKKEEYKLLKINKETDTIEFVSLLHGIINSLDKIYEKNNLGIKLKVYQVSEKSLNTEGYGIFNINPENALNKIKDEPIINLYSIQLKPETPAIGLSNIIYYDNFNKTLPTGMDISDEILIDISKLDLELKRQRLFRINIETNEQDVKTKTICAYEYEIRDN